MAPPGKAKALTTSCLMTEKEKGMRLRTSSGSEATSCLPISGRPKSKSAYWNRSRATARRPSATSSSSGIVRTIAAAAQSPSGDPYQAPSTAETTPPRMSIPLRVCVTWCTAAPKSGTASAAAPVVLARCLR
eukprot:scaffold21581_cov101-Isochrysis_galbana.AAC.4